MVREDAATRVQSALRPHEVVMPSLLPKVVESSHAQQPTSLLAHLDEFGCLPKPPWVR